MKLFTLGFLAATAIFAGLLFAQSRGATVVFENTCCTQLAECAAAPPADETEMVEEPTDDPAAKRRQRGHRRARRTNGTPLPSGPGYREGEGSTGDDLSSGAREASMDGDAEEQLSNTDIDQGIDRAFNGIQRCLTLMPPDAPSAGTVKIGMQIAPAGTVTRVNLKGPNAMIQGECGACLRRTVKGIRFRSFSGPEMTVHYPIAFE